MRMDGINGSGTGTMKHSEAMHKAHHGGQTEPVVKAERIDSFQKTEGSNKLKMYDAKGILVTKPSL